MEKPVKKASVFVPKMFKTFAIYIFLTLAVFYGYIQIYGNITNDNGISDTNQGQAEDDTFFGNFVTNLMGFKSVDTDISFSVDNSQMHLALAGNVIFDLNTKGLYLDLDLDYKDKQMVSAQADGASDIFKVVATYTAPYLYVQLDNTFYKFDCDGDLDLSYLTNLLKDNVKFDENSLGEILAKIGLGDLDVNELVAEAMEQLKQEPTQDANGNYRLAITLKNLIKAHLVCDEKYNLISVRLDNGTIIKGNAITFEAKNIQMNKVVDISFDETGLDLVDMSGVTEYLSYAQNLFKNQYVSADVVVDYNQNQYLAEMIIETSPALKINMQTNFEGTTISLSYANEEVYLDVGSLKLKLKTKDYAVWEEKLNKILENQTSQDVAGFVKGLLMKYCNIDVDNLDVTKEIMKILAGGENSQAKLALMLPQATSLSENSFTMQYANQMTATLTKNEQLLESVSVVYDGVAVNATFAVANEGFEISGLYYDASALLPLADLVDEILTAKAFGGQIDVNIKNVDSIEVVSCEYVVDFNTQLKVKANTTLFGEKVEIYFENDKLYLAVGSIVLSGDVNNIENYLQQIDEIFATKISTQLGTKVDVSAVIAQILAVLNNIKLYAQDGYMAVVEYLSYLGNLKYENNTAEVSVAINENVNVSATVATTDKTVSIPAETDTVDSVLAKIQSVKTLVDSKTYAGRFEFVYNNIVLTGEIKADLNAKVYQVVIDKIGNHKLVVTYLDGVVYVEYAESKIQAQVENAKQLYAMLKPIVLANLTEEEQTALTSNKFDLSKILISIFGEDVSVMPMEDVLKKVTVSLQGNLSDLIVNGAFASEIAQNAVISVKFEENNLKTVEVNWLDEKVLEENKSKAKLVVLLQDYSKPAVEAQDYLNLLSKFSGTLIVDLPNSLSLPVDVKLDLTENIVLDASLAMLGTTARLTISNDDVFVQVGNLNAHAKLTEARETFEFVLETFNLALPKAKKLNVQEILNTLDLNSFDPANIANLTWRVHKSQEENTSDIEVNYAKENLTVNVSLNEVETLKVEALAKVEDCETIKNALLKANNIKKAIEGRIFEADYNMSYNGWDFAGTFKFVKDDQQQIVEIVANNVCGEKVVIRLQNNVMYFAYGNMKFKYTIPQNSNETTQKQSYKEILNKITADTFKVQIDFGDFLDIVEMLRDYSFEDYLNNIKLSLNGNFNNIEVEINNKVGAVTSKIANANIAFNENKLSKVDVNVRNILKASVTQISTEKSTIAPFDEENYKDYAENYLDGLLNSLQFKEGVYAFGSDIAIRYSTNTFEGELVVMLVKEEGVKAFKGLKGYSGFVEGYKPVLSLHTTALGLDTYAYIVDETLYIDLNGFQISAKICDDSIDEILNFVETNFLKDKVSEEKVEGFRTILPALTQIYGAWLEGGLQIDINGNLWYSQKSNFSDMVLQVLIENKGQIIVPTQIVLGANIHDPNTKVYEDGYEKYSLECEKAITKNLNFAVYLNNMVVGQNLSNLSTLFVKNENDQDFANITSVKSTQGTTKLSDFNDYKNVLDIVESVLEYGKAMQFAFNVNASIASETTTTISGDVVTQISDDVEKKAQFKLFDDKILKVQGDLNILAGKNDGTSSNHKVSLLYDNFNTGLFASYSHGNLIGKKEFNAKINNAHMSELVSMICGFANIKMSDAVMKQWNLTENTTDFRYLKTLMKMKEPESTNISKADSLLNTITKYASQIEQVKIEKKAIENSTLSQTILSVLIDLEPDKTYEGKTLTNIQVVFKETMIENTVELKLDIITLNNLRFGGKTINVAIAIKDFAESMFNYDTTKAHIDISEIAEFVDIAITTLNTKGFNFKGTANAKIVGNTIPIDYDVSAILDEHNKLKLHVELQVGFMRDVTSSALINPKYTTYIASVSTKFEKRVTTLDFYDGELQICQKTFDNQKNAVSKKQDITFGPGNSNGVPWTYRNDEIGSNFKIILAQAIGLNEATLDLIDFAMNFVHPSPTIEECLLGFEKVGDSFKLKLSGSNLTGMSAVQDLEVTLGVSKGVDVKVSNSELGEYQKTHRFIDSVTTEFKMGSIVTVPLDMKSVSGEAYKVNEGKKSSNGNSYCTGFIFYTNDHYRNQYINSIKAA